MDRPRRASWLDLNSPTDFEWNRVRLPIAGLPAALAALKIVHITDIHIRSRWRDAFGLLLHRLQQARPDLILCTGDFVHNKVDHRPALPAMYRLLEGFQARLGCFAVLGNHDTAALAPRLAGTNIRLIAGQRHLVEVDGATLELIGLQGVKRKELTPGFIRSMPPRSAQKDTVRIVLSHYPDHIRRAEALEADIFLAGHTHGGQICLPGGFPLIRHDTLPRRLCTGIHRVGPTWLVVGRGLGGGTPPVRLFCPAEVLEVRMMSET